MGKFQIDDDCLAPRRTRWINYSGSDPLAWTREGTAILRNCFEVTTVGTGEPRWMWDWSGDPIQMYHHRMALHSGTTGRFSKIIFSVKMVGFKYKAKNEGTFRMEIEPTVRHKFEGNKFVMFMWWIYWHVFYNAVRKTLLERCREMTEKFVAIIKEMYSMGSLEEE